MSGPNFTFSTNVPQAGQKINATQVPIQNNFQALNELINVNHVGFGDNINYGKHNFTTFPLQASDPSTSSTEMAMYAKSTPGGPNLCETFIRYPSNGMISQITGSSIGQGGAFVNGWSLLPGNILMKWGQATGIVAGANTITFPTTGIPAFTTSIFIVTYTPASSYTLTAPTAYITGQTLAHFILNVPTTMSSTISWMAIGI